MIADPDWSVIGPHARGLQANGYGFSAVKIGSDIESLIDMLADWGWSSSEQIPTWLSERSGRQR